MNGKPGTGKSHLLSIYKKKINFELKKIKETPQNFKIEYMNAMNFENCWELLKRILIFINYYLEDRIIEINIKPNFILNQIKKKISTKKIIFIVIIDEIDSLLIKDNDNFKFIHDFLIIRNSFLFKIVVSNTFSIFEEGDPFEYLNFKPYTLTENLKIIKNILSVENINEYFDLEAIKYIIKKNYKNNSGDIRSLFSLFKNTIREKINEIKENKKLKKINLNFVLENNYDNKVNYKNLFDSLNRDSKILLYVVYKLSKKLDIELSFKEIKNQIKKINTIIDLEDNQNVEESSNLLVSYGFIKIVKNNVIELKLKLEDISKIFDKSTTIKTIQKFI